MKKNNKWTGRSGAQVHKSKGQHKYNAKKVTVDGFVFDSKLEARCYGLLKQFKIEFTMQSEYELQPAMPIAEDCVFQKFGKKRTLTLQKISSRVDFDIQGLGMKFIIDTKGVMLQDSINKYKMLFYKLREEGHIVEMYFPSNIKEVNECLRRILFLQGK
jgi:hypothetical protein